MIRFGLNTFLVSSGFTDNDLPLLQEFKRYGADVIELAIVDPSAVSVDTLKAALKENDLDQPVVCGAFGGGRDLRGTTAQREACIQYIRELIHLANELGAKVVCGPFYSETGRSGPHTEEEREIQFEQIAEALRPLCKEAESLGIMLAMEPLNRFETDCINTLEQAVEMIERVGSPALKIHIDTFHMQIEEADSSKAILQAGNHIGHVHASASHRGLLGRDQVDWMGVLGALQEIGYAGDIVIESFSKDNTVIARAASIWRDLYDSPAQLAVEGLAFLRSNWKVLDRQEEAVVNA
jgi:D-psicose/D-tagatose/L-ribulose 3-epimerase